MAKKVKLIIPKLEYKILEEYPKAVIDLFNQNEAFRKHKENCDFAQKGQLFVKDTRTDQESIFKKEENKEKESKKTEDKREANISGHYVSKDSSGRIEAQCGCGLRMILNDKGGVDFINPNQTDKGSGYMQDSNVYMSESKKEDKKQYD